MARIRTIKPDFWESESVGRLSMGARLLFIACLNFADDEGLLRWNESYLGSQAFVYDEPSNEQIREWMCELVNEGIVYPYKSGIGNQQLGWIIKFRQHQVINRPQASKLQPPSLQNTDIKEQYFKRDNYICHLCNEPIEQDKVNISGSKAASIDHIKPVSKGGTDYPSNIRTAHLSCNKSRRNKSLNDSVNESGNGSVAEEERKGKGSNPPNPLSPSLAGAPPDFSEFWQNYPSNFGSQDSAAKAYELARRQGATHQQILIGAKNYAKLISQNGTDPEFVTQAANWLKEKKWTVDYQLRPSYTPMHPGAGG